MPKADYVSGRAARGYFCNTRLVAHQGASGGFKTLRYTDKQGDTCAFYDSTLLLPRDVASNLITGDGLGVVVLDMNDPKHPRKTANLTSLAMLTPHESLLVNKKRGLLVAEMGTAATLPGIMDIYDVKTDCRRAAQAVDDTGRACSGTRAASRATARRSTPPAPRLGSRRSTCRTPASRAGSTRSSTSSTTASRLSDDGKTMYVAHVGEVTGAGISGGELRILDVSDIQERKPDPEVTILSALSWQNPSSRRWPSPSPAAVTTTCSRWTSSWTCSRSTG